MGPANSSFGVTMKKILKDMFCGMCLLCENQMGPENKHRIKNDRYVIN